MTPPMQRVRRASAAATEACGAGGLPRAQTQRRAPARVRASGRPPPRAACGPGGLPRAQTQRRGFVAFISHGAANDYASDVEDIETERTHQGSVSESSPEQSYDLEGDFTTSGSGSNLERHGRKKLNRLALISLNSVFFRGGWRTPSCGINSIVSY